MAGMLPGVETARRRRLHQGGSMNSSVGSRRSQSSSSFLKRSSFVNKGSQSGELGDVAREAKERLDERLRNQRTTEIIKRYNSEITLGAPGVISNVQREVFSQRKFSWSKMGWRASEQKECAVCLENFSTGDILMHLTCSHRFHWSCAMPWIESTSQCPCCRTIVMFSPSCSSSS